LNICIVVRTGCHCPEKKKNYLKITSISPSFPPSISREGMDGQIATKTSSTTVWTRKLIDSGAKTTGLQKLYPYPSLQNKTKTSKQKTSLATTDF